MNILICQDLQISWRIIYWLEVFEIVFFSKVRRA
jgi:hypothetical protein